MPVRKYVEWEEGGWLDVRAEIAESSDGREHYCYKAIKHKEGAQQNAVNLCEVSQATREVEDGMMGIMSN